MQNKNTWGNGVFPKWKGNLLNSGNLINNWNMNWDQFKDPVSYLCLAGWVVTSYSLTQEIAGSSNLFDKYFVVEFSENI